MMFVIGLMALFALAFSAIALFVRPDLTGSVDELRTEANWRTREHTDLERRLRNAEKSLVAVHNRVFHVEQEKPRKRSPRAPR